MNVWKNKARTSLILFSMAGSLALCSAPGLAAGGPSASASTDGPGMISSARTAQTRGQGQPQVGNRSPGYRAGGGMMGGWGGGSGTGIMGGCAAGHAPGAMRGWDGGHGMHSGMMRGYDLIQALPDLSDEQESRIEKIYTDAREKHWDLVGKSIAAAGKLHDLLADDDPDREAVDAAYKTLVDIRLQQLESRLDRRTKVNEVLTKEQRAQLYQWRHGAITPWH